MVGLPEFDRDVHRQSFPKSQGFPTQPPSTFSHPLHTSNHILPFISSLTPLPFPPPTNTLPSSIKDKIYHLTKRFSSVARTTVNETMEERVVYPFVDEKSMKKIEP